MKPYYVVLQSARRGPFMAGALRLQDDLGSGAKQSEVYAHGRGECR